MANHPINQAVPTPTVGARILDNGELLIYDHHATCEEPGWVRESDPESCVSDGDIRGPITLLPPRPEPEESHPMELLEQFDDPAASIGGMRAKIMAQGFSGEAAEALVVEMWKDALHQSRCERETKLLELRSSLSHLFGGGRRGRA
jgi:hypothetical protein